MCMGAYTMQKGQLFMRKSPRVVIPLTVFGLVTAGGITAGLTLVANAQTTATFCDSSASSGTTAAPITCTTDTETITSPTAINLVVDLTAGDGAATTDQYVVVTWTGDCSQGSTDDAISSPSTPPEETISTTSEVTVGVTLPMTNPDDCDIEATATLYTSSGTAAAPADTTGTFQLNMEYDTSATSTATSTSTSTPSSVDVAYISGYGGKCIDDRGNSSSNGAEVILWGCNHGDSAQGWTWTDYELRHNGMCANDPGYGGSGTKLILYSCTGSSNEKWSHVSYGEFKLFYSGRGQLCLDDPGYSTTNGTRLMVYNCNNGGNQHWSRS
jgi:hypothetical protein